MIHLISDISNGSLVKLSFGLVHLSLPLWTQILSLCLEIETEEKLVSVPKTKTWTRYSLLQDRSMVYSYEVRNYWKYKLQIFKPSQNYTACIVGKYTARKESEF